MSVANTTVHQIWQGNGSTTTFQIPCDFIAGSGSTVIKVYLVSTAGTLTLQTYTTHYTFDSTSAPVNVVFVTAPSASYYVMIVRVHAITQPTDYIDTGRFPAESHERAMDRLLYLIQELDERLDRAPVRSVIQTLDQKLPVGAASEFLGLNAAADGWAWYSSSEIANPSAQVSHTLTDGQSATALSGETVNSATYTSAIYGYEIIRGTTVFSTGIFSLHYRNAAWYIVQGEERREDAAPEHGVTLTLTGTTIAQINAACDTGAGNGTIKVRRYLFI